MNTLFKREQARCKYKLYKQKDNIKQYKLMKEKQKLKELAREVEI